ncbi:MAG: hypothetical protein JWM10_528 [Myxococcaceae bacterium]|nr:hypothetical protein [Myxococcaceae bacterium]
MALPSDEVIRERLAMIEALAKSDRRVRVLEAIGWPREVEERFFAGGAEGLPEVTYEVDRDPLNERVAALDAAEQSLEGDDPVTVWMRSTVGSMRDASRMVLALGTAEFSRLSKELYGGPRTRFHGGGERNIDLAHHVIERLRPHGTDEATDEECELLDAEALAESLRQRVAREYPSMVIAVVVDPEATAKVVAGSTRVRVRADATFTPWEADALWHHEVETHALTGQNGAAQPEAGFLRVGGPRSTRTQEGLAVFTELHHHCASIERLQRLANRVLLVDMAEQGANFVDLYRHLVGQGATPREAYLDAQRVCRGGLVTGRAPFTKDTVYLAGLLDVQAFLSAVVREGFRDEMELLSCGRIALEDLTALVHLRRRGILQRPRYIPAWLRRWRTLVPEFAFLSFLDTVALGRVQLRYEELIAAATEV